MNQLLRKVIKRVKNITISFAREKKWYPALYKSYWHHKAQRPKEVVKTENYFSAVPNYDAGIGHQLANWIAGYWFAKQLNLKFAHIPFSSKKWDYFLGFGEDEISVKKLISEQDYIRVKLPLFDESKPDELKLINEIISSYKDKKVVFIAEQDQSYKDQYGVITDIKYKFNNAKARQTETLLYSDKYFNIAIHVRRGDIVIGKENHNPNLTMRWQNNNYFENVLRRVVDNLKSDKPIAIYFFSQGTVSDFSEFKKFSNLHFCLDMNAQNSFLHMSRADLLITSKSSFSYKPALLNDGIKICPRDFWHSYPNSENFILADEDGVFNEDDLTSIKL